MSLLAQLKRHRVFRAALMYVGVAWATAHLADALERAWDLPEWVLPFLLFVLVLGFPVAMVLTWASDLERGGIESTVARSGMGVSGKLTNLALLIGGTCLLIWLLTSRWPSHPISLQPHPHSVEATRPHPGPD